MKYHEDMLLLHALSHGQNHSYTNHVVTKFAGSEFTVKAREIRKTNN